MAPAPKPAKIGTTVRPALKQPYRIGEDLRQHGQAERDAVARFEAEGAESVGDLVGLGVDLVEGSGAGGAVLGFPDAGDAVGGGPAVQAVVGDVEGAAGEPLRPLGPREASSTWW